MDVRNCKKCGRIFNYVSGQPICIQCKNELEVVFKEVRQFIRKNPQSSIQIVSEECGVDVKQIKEWIREERLSFSSDSEMGIECEKCGTIIKTGRFCNACKAETLSELNSVQTHKKRPDVDKAPPKDNKSSGMHYKVNER